MVGLVGMLLTDSPSLSHPHLHNEDKAEGRSKQLALNGYLALFFCGLIFLMPYLKLDPCPYLSNVSVFVAGHSMK